MADFPPFTKNPKNRIDAASRLTDDVEGYVFEGADGSQVVFFTAKTGGTSSEHAHPFDEYVLVVEGSLTVIIGEDETLLTAGSEMRIPKGIRRRMRVTAGTRTVHAFGGKRAERERAG